MRSAVQFAYYTALTAAELTARMAECIEMAPCSADAVGIKFFIRPGEMAVSLQEVTLTDGSKVYDLHVFHAAE